MFIKRNLIKYALLDFFPMDKNNLPSDLILLVDMPQENPTDFPKIMVNQGLKKFTSSNWVFKNDFNINKSTD